MENNHYPHNNQHLIIHSPKLGKLAAHNNRKRDIHILSFKSTIESKYFKRNFKF